MKSSFLLIFSLISMQAKATICWSEPIPAPLSLISKYKASGIKIKKPILYFKASSQDIKKLIKEEFTHLDVFDFQDPDQFHEQPESNIISKIDINQKVPLRINYFPKNSEFKILSWTESQIKSSPFKGKVTIDSKISGPLTLTFEDFFNVFTDERIKGSYCGERGRENSVSKKILDQLDRYNTKENYKLLHCIYKSEQNSQIEQFKAKINKALSAFELEKEISYSVPLIANVFGNRQFCFPVEMKTTEAFLTFKYIFPEIIGGR